jgi:biopolymer transport protein ExbD
MEQHVTITLPEAVYERVKVTAEAMELPLETVITQSVEILLPAFEEDMPLDTQADLVMLTFLSDTQLWKVAHHTMDKQKQNQLETLAETQKHRVLNAAEQAELDQLMQEAQHLMVAKAEAFRLLAQRGHSVFSDS